MCSSDSHQVLATLEGLLRVSPSLAAALITLRPLQPALRLTLDCYEARTQQGPQTPSLGRSKTEEPSFGLAKVLPWLLARRAHLLPTSCAMYRPLKAQPSASAFRRQGDSPNGSFVHRPLPGSGVFSLRSASGLGVARWLKPIPPLPVAHTLPPVPAESSPARPQAPVTQVLGAPRALPVSILGCPLPQGTWSGTLHVHARSFGPHGPMPGFPGTFTAEGAMPGVLTAEAHGLPRTLREVFAAAAESGAGGQLDALTVGHEDIDSLRFLSPAVAETLAQCVPEGRRSVAVRRLSVPFPMFLAVPFSARALVDLTLRIPHLPIHSAARGNAHGEGGRMPNWLELELPCLRSLDLTLSFNACPTAGLAQELAEGAAGADDVALSRATHVPPVVALHHCTALERLVLRSRGGLWTPGLMPGATAALAALNGGQVPQNFAPSAQALESVLSDFLVLFDQHVAEAQKERARTGAAHGDPFAAACEALHQKIVTDKFKGGQKEAARRLEYLRAAFLLGLGRGMPRRPAVVPPPGASGGSEVAGAPAVGGAVAAVVSARLMQRNGSGGGRGGPPGQGAAPATCLRGPSSSAEAAGCVWSAPASHVLEMLAEAATLKLPLGMFAVFPVQGLGALPSLRSFAFEAQTAAEESSLYLALLPMLLPLARAPQLRALRLVLNRRELAAPNLKTLFPHDEVPALTALFRRFSDLRRLDLRPALPLATMLALPPKLTALRVEVAPYLADITLPLSAALRNLKEVRHMYPFLRHFSHYYGIACSFLHSGLLQNFTLLSSYKENLFYA